MQRFIRITYLLPELMDLLDKGKLAFNPAVDISYLKVKEQKELLSAMDYTQAAPSISQTQRIKELSQNGNLHSRKTGKSFVATVIMADMGEGYVKFNLQFPQR